MKQIIINNCNGCGMCMVKCPQYFEENDEGNAKVISGVLASDDNVVLNDVIAQCPVNAISFGEEVDSQKNLQEYINKLNDMKSGITVTKNDIEFHEAYTRNVFVPSAGIS